jgi:ligand-binding sensor domain-containing protein/signal transduction histidine kinase
VCAQDIIPRFETLTVENGLPHSSIYSIYQDKKGFMWFATPNGLSRYDGNKIQTFKYSPRNDSDVVNNFIRRKLLEDKDNNIWYSNESGIYKWDALTERIYKVKEVTKKLLGSSGFELLDIDDKGSLWIVNVIKGVFEFNTKTGELKNYSLPYRIDYNSFTDSRQGVDAEGNIWFSIFARKQQYFFFDRKLRKYVIKFADNAPHNIFFDKEKTLHCFNDRIVFTDNKTGKQTIVKKIIDGKPFAFYSIQCVKDNAERYWFTSRGDGLFCYEAEKKVFRRYTRDNSKIKSLPFDITTCFFIDRSDNLWIGFDGAGVSRVDLKPPKFNIFPLSEGDHPILKDYFIKCFYEDEQKNIWFGTHNSGLNIFSPATGTLRNFQHKKGDRHSLPGNIVGSIVKDKQGNIWVGSSGGISLLDVKTGIFTTIPIKGLPSRNSGLRVLVNKIIDLQDGSLLAATFFGLVKIVKNETGDFSAFLLEKSRSSGTIADVMEMHDKTIYIAMPFNGMFSVRQNGETYDIISGFFKGMDIKSISRDEVNDNYLWICTGTGLMHFNTKTYKYRLWNEHSKLPDNYLYGSLEDGDHNLWISTNRGLSYFDRQTGNFENYTFQDGLQSNEFNTQAFYKGRSGTLYFGGIKGFNWINTNTISNSAPKCRAAITKIEINDSSYSKTNAFFSNQQIEVAFDKNDFYFAFAALDYSRPDANKIQYKLEGWDTKWVNTSARSVRYSKLLPGKYTFKIRASSDHNNWGDEESVFIYVRPPFWKLTWFIVTMIILLTGMVIYGTYLFMQRSVRKKVRELEKQHAIDAERDRISRDMHDEIGSGLTHIALLSELIKTQQKGAFGIQKEISIISDSARKLVTDISEIIWALNSHNDSLENLLSYTREQMQRIFENLAMELKIDFPDAVPHIRLTNEQRRNIYLVTKEALNNAIKHGDKGVIMLGCFVNGSYILFSVRNNSHVQDTNRIQGSGNGMRNMRKRIQDIGGTIEFINEEHEFTVRYTFRAIQE